MDKILEILMTLFEKWIKKPFISSFITDDRWEMLLEGLGNTLLITLAAALIGVLIGIIVAMIRTTYDNNLETWSRRGGFGFFIMKILNALCKIYLSVFRGTPVMVQLLIAYLIILSNVDNTLIVAILAFGVNSGAYVAEIMRSGIMSIDRGQIEAGRSLGFNYAQTMLRIVLPQALKNTLPPLLNEFIALLKETSVAGYIGVRDLNKAGELIRGVSFEIFMPLFAVAAIYLIVVLLLTYLVGKLERRLRRSDH